MVKMKEITTSKLIRIKYLLKNTNPNWENHCFLIFSAWIVCITTI